MQDFKNIDIILASQSPRRQQLLGDLGLNFRTCTKDGIDEIYPESVKGADIAVFLSELKAKAFVDELRPNSILITADTIVLLDEQVLGKPESRDQAIEMISKLSGKKHQVVTGVSLSSMKKQVSFASYTDVFFRPLTEDEIIYYVDTYKPFDKAGAYGIQEWIGYIGVERIEGSYFNVMGLPVQQLYDRLVQFAQN